MTARILNGWKEIAGYIGRGIRTVQRWQSFGLPIHRVDSQTRPQAVFALTTEIEAWLANTPVASYAAGRRRRRATSPPAIVAVDDDEVHLYALQRVLSSAGFNVITASTGQQALHHILARKPNAILLDVNLPDLNGFEVCKQVRAHPELRSVPVIFHSATHNTKTAFELAEQVGASAFLTYPLQHQHLIALLGAFISTDVHSYRVNSFHFDPNSRIT